MAEAAETSGLWVFLIQRVVGVPGQRQSVDALEVTACAFGVVTRGGDLGTPMPSPISRITFFTVLSDSDAFSAAV